MFSGKHSDTDDRVNARGDDQHHEQGSHALAPELAHGEADQIEPKGQAAQALKGGSLALAQQVRRGPAGGAASGSRQFVGL